MGKEQIILQVSNKPVFAATYLVRERVPFTYDVRNGVCIEFQDTDSADAVTQYLRLSGCRTQRIYKEPKNE